MSADRPTLLVRGGTVLTMDPDRRVLDPGYVAVRGSEIIGVGPDDECPYPDAVRVIDAQGHAVLPGFVDAHAHSLDILIRGGVSDDRRLYDWLVNINLPAARAYRIEDNALAVRLWSLEAQRSGITTVVDQIETPYPEWDENADVVVDAYIGTGLRAVVGQMFYDTEPPEMTTLMGAYAARHPELSQDLGARPGGLDEMLARIDGMIRRHHGPPDGRISSGPRRASRCCAPARRCWGTGASPPARGDDHRARRRVAHRPAAARDPEHPVPRLDRLPRTRRAGRALRAGRHRRHPARCRDRQRRLSTQR